MFCPSCGKEIKTLSPSKLILGRIDSTTRYSHGQRIDCGECGRAFFVFYVGAETIEIGTEVWWTRP